MDRKLKNRSTKKTEEIEESWLILHYVLPSSICCSLLALLSLLSTFLSDHVTCSPKLY